MGWVHDTSAPYRHEENSVAERDVRLEKDGIRAALVQAGLPPQWWPLVGEHFSFSLNIEKNEGEDLSAWQNRHKGHEFWGLKIPCGALCHFRPVQPKRDRLPEFAPRAIPGLFLGYFLQPGGRWTGDYLVADLDDFRKGRKVHVQRIKEVFEEEGEVVFPLRKERDTTLFTVDPELAKSSLPDDTAEPEDDIDDDREGADGGKPSSS